VTSFPDLALVLVRTLADAAWQASLASVALLVAERLMPRIASRWRAALLTLAALRFAWPPVVGLPAPFGVKAPLDLSGSLLPHALDPGPEWTWAAGAALLVWGIGTLARMTSLWVARARLMSQVQALGSAAPETRRVHALARRMGIARIPTPARMPGAAAPFVFGWRHPVLVLPERGLVPGEARLALLHELAHVRRGDLLVRELLTWLGALWWWNPLFAVTSRRLREVQEEACDDLAMAVGGATPERYGRMIVREATAWRLAVDHRRGPVESVAGLGGPSLERRLRRLLQSERAVRPSLVHLLILCAALAMTLPRATSPAWRVVHLHGEQGLSSPKVHLDAAWQDDDHRAQHQAQHQARHRSHH